MIQVLLGALIGISAILFILILRSFTTFFHEMGHAIPALLFTKENVKIFIGTYGDTNKGTKFQTGRLEIYFQMNLLDWQKGLCQYHGNITLWQDLIIAISGPIASLLLSIPLFLIVINQNLSETWIVVIMIFVIAAAIDFFVNIIPTRNKVLLQNGSDSYNDGQQIYLLLSRFTYPEIYFEIEDKFYKKKYAEVIETCQATLSAGNTKRVIYELLLMAYIKEKKFEDAIATYEIFKEKYKLRHDDYYNIANIYTGMNKHNEALKYFDHCLHLEHDNSVVLNDRAYLKIQQGDYEEAIADLDAAIHYSPDLAKAYLNRGLAKIRMANYQAAYTDLMQAKALDQTNPHLFYYLGLHYEKQHEYEQALSSYTQAKEMNIAEQGIDYTIEMVKEKLRIRS